MLRRLLFALALLAFAAPAPVALAQTAPGPSGSPDPSSPSVEPRAPFAPDTPDLGGAPADLPQSQCLAVARGLGDLPVRYASLAAPAQADPFSVTIRFATHSTYVIETPGGVTIATDFAGWAGPGVTPRVVTMNRAHSSHYTMSPDPAIEHVLPGWGAVPGEPAAHALTVDDVFIRNVTTDIDRWGERSPDANSIFVFEVAGLCIAHLGHLHHRLADRHYAQLGRMDVLMVPVDGGLTLNHEGMTEVVRRLRSSIILPMHRRGQPLSRFVAMLGEGFAVETLAEPVMTLSLRDLPSVPTVVVMPGI